MGCSWPNTGPQARSSTWCEMGSLAKADCSSRADLWIHGFAAMTMTSSHAMPNLFRTLFHVEQPRAAILKARGHGHLGDLPIWPGPASPFVPRPRFPTPWTAGSSSCRGPLEPPGLEPQAGFPRGRVRKRQLTLPRCRRGGSSRRTAPVARAAGPLPFGGAGTCATRPGGDRRLIQHPPGRKTLDPRRGCAEDVPHRGCAEDVAAGPWLEPP